MTDMPSKRKNETNESKMIEELAKEYDDIARALLSRLTGAQP